MSTNKQKFTGKKRSHPEAEETSDNDYRKSAEARKRNNENFDRRSYQNHPSMISQNIPSKRYENNKDQQKLILNTNNYYKKSSYQNVSSKTKPDHNYSISSSRSPSIHEGNYNPNSNGFSNDYNYRKNQQNEAGKNLIGFGANVHYKDSRSERDKRPHEQIKDSYAENGIKPRDSRDFRVNSYNRDNNQQRNKNNFSNNEQNGHGRNYDKYPGNDPKYQNRSSNRYNYNDYSSKNSNINISNRPNRADYDDYYRKPNDFNNKKSWQNYNSHSDRDMEKDKITNNSLGNTHSKRDKEEKEKVDNRRNTKQTKNSDKRSSSVSRSSHNSLSRSRYESISKEFIPQRSKSGSRNKNINIKRIVRRGSLIPIDAKSSKKNDFDADNNIIELDVKLKRFNFLMCLPKNYYRFIEKDYGILHRDIKKKVRDLKYLQYTYIVKGFPDNVLRIDANKVSSNAEVLRMVCDFIFKEMRQTYQNMTYLKISILVPSHVVGFIIGIEGKNINKIRDNSGAKIDVFHVNINNRYRQIELAGSVASLATAAEQIYRFVNKYYYCNPNLNENGSKISDKENRKDSVENDLIHKSLKDDKKNNYQKNRKERIVLGGGDRKRIKSRRERSRDKGKSETKSDRKHRDQERKRYQTEDKNYSPSISISKSMRDYTEDLNLEENFNNNLIDDRFTDNKNAISNLAEENIILNNQSVEVIDDLILNKEIAHGNENNLYFKNNAYNSSFVEVQQNQHLFNSNPQILANIQENVNIKHTIISHQIIKTNEIPENQVLNKEQIKIESAHVDDYNKIPETNIINNSNELINKNEHKGKISIDMIVPIKTLNLLKNFQNNIYIEMENKYGCQITKRSEKLANNEELNILTFYGEPEQNSYALFYLMRHISDIENK